MSVVTVSAIHDLAGHDAYVHEGRGEQRREHIADGSDRLAPGSRADLPREDFVALAQHLARAHGRRVEALGIVVAWSPDELSIDNPDDLQLAGDHAYALAKRLHPHSPVSVVTHIDSAGGHVHCHVAVLNHRYDTGRALTTGRRHREVAAINDELSREQGLRVIEVAPKAATPTDAPFDDLLRERLGDALADPATLDWPTFVAAAAARGVEVVTVAHEIKSDARRGKRRGDTAMGVTYRALDEVGPKRRMRRRKASALGPDFTFDEITALLAERAAARQQEREQAQQQERSPAARSTHPARGRSGLVSSVQGVLLRGAYVSLPGYAALALRIGVQVAHARKRPGLEYGWNGEEQRWHESSLPPELSEAQVLARIAEQAQQHAADIDAEEQLRARPRRRRPISGLPDAAQRAAELRGIERQRSGRSL